MNDTLGQTYEEISEGLATARTLALTGRQEEAQQAYQQARLTFDRYKESLQGYPGFAALEYALDVTINTLQREGEICHP